ncbi:MAG: hypothetical protein Q8N17_14555 [Burkholderiaceae bacterium]|nr:hypothetical protein [Burkholderiaceae bacterium]
METSMNVLVLPLGGSGPMTVETSMPLPGPANGGDVDRFSQLMQAPAGGTTEPTEVPPNQAGGVMDVLEKFSARVGDARAVVQNITDSAASSKSLGIADSLKATMAMHEYTLHVTGITELGNKASKHINELSNLK